jgi:hypothetical protein
MASDGGVMIGTCAGTGGMGRLVGRLAAMLFLTFGLSACAIPPAISLISLAADGVLLAATGKSKTDHGMSMATGQDCATFRALEGEDVCQDIVIAQTEPMPAAINRELVALRVGTPRDVGFGRAELAMTTAFHAARSAPVVLAAAPRPVLVNPPATPQLAALRAPQTAAITQTGATPGRVKLDRPDPARIVASVAKARLASVKPVAQIKGKRWVQAKSKRFATIKNKRMAEAKAKPQQRLGAATQPVLPAPSAAPAPVAPARLTLVVDGDQLALVP